MATARNGSYKENSVNYPLHLEVQKLLRDRIQSGAVRAGEKLGTEVELAKEYGVSRTTIRHALISLEEEGCIERIHGRGTFVAELEQKKNTANDNSIYVIVPHLTNEFTGNIVVGAQSVFFSAGYNLSVFSTNDSIEKEMEYISNILDRGAAGVVLHPTKARYYNPSVLELVQSGIPMVMTGRHYRHVNASYIEADNYQGAYDAATYLIGLGHSRIGLVSKPPMIETSLQDRITGFMEAMADHDLPINRKHMLTNLVDPRNVYRQARDEIQEEKIMNQLVDYLTNSPEMTGIIALNDLIAADLVKAAKLCGKTVGRDLAIVGFDNVTLSASLDPPLTTVDCPTLEIGQMAARVLLKQIEKQEQNLSKEHLPMKLVIRKSCVVDE